jgi:hypothetical protein
LSEDWPTERREEKQRSPANKGRFSWQIRKIFMGMAKHSIVFLGVNNCQAIVVAKLPIAAQKARIRDGQGL